MIDGHSLLAAETVDISRARELFQAMASQKVELHVAHLTLMQEISKLLTPEQQQCRAMRTPMMHGHWMGKASKNR